MRRRKKKERRNVSDKYTGWNDKIVALEKTTIPFPFNENRFSFFFM